MQDELLEIINKNLPAMVGKELVAQLQAGQAAIATNKDLRRKIEAQEVNIASLNDKLYDQTKLDNLKSSLDDRDRDLHQRRVQLEIDSAKNAVAIANARADTALEAMRLMMRNVDVRRSITEQGCTLGNGQYGSMSVPTSNQRVETEEHT